MENTERKKGLNQPLRVCIQFRNYRSVNGVVSQYEN